MKCKHSSTTMSKKGLDFVCNKCGGVVLGVSDMDFMESEYQAEVKAELDAEMRMEADDVRSEMLKGDEDI